jgi:TonB-linked SusC/RagA family outer membrane protein
MIKRLLLSICAVAASVSVAFAQAKTVSGTVKDDKGGAASFVTVVEKGTNNATTTNENGFYAIKVAGNEAILLFKAVGFKDKEVPVGVNSQLNVKLENNSKVLGQVVVNAIGLTVSKDKVGSAQSSVGGAQVVNSGETSVLTGLSAKASGVQIQRSTGDPGAGAYIQIRGQNTIFGNNQPLFIIDGVPVSNTSTDETTDGNQVDGVAQQSRLNDINPNDIADIQILKGVAATALWGTRAANGVVIIKTKTGGKGYKDRMSISFSNTVSFDQVNRYVPLQNTYGQGFNGIFGQGGGAGRSQSYGDRIADRSGEADEYDFAGGYVLFDDGRKVGLVKGGTAADKNGGKNSKQVYDHQKELFKTGFYMDNNLSISGGDQKSSYFVSGGRLKQSGIIRNNSDFERYSLRFNADRRLSERLKVSTNIAYSNTNSNRIQQGSNTSGLFLSALRTSPDFDNTNYTGTFVNAAGVQFPNRQVSYRNPIGARENSIYDNPFWLIENISSKARVNRVLASAEANIIATDWLDFTLRPGIDFSSDKRQDFFPYLAATTGNAGRFRVRQIQETQFNVDAFGKAAKTFNKNFGMVAVLGLNFNDRQTENVSTTVSNYILNETKDFFTNLSNSSNSSRSATNSETNIGQGAVYSQVDFDVLDQVFLSLTGRAEKVSTVKDVFFYPSASLSWNFTKPLGFTSDDMFSFGKLRLSAGQVGVQPGAYLSQTYFVPLDPNEFLESWGTPLDAGSSLYGGGYTRDYTFGNNALKPEIKSEFEIGTDLRFLKDKISLGFTYYQNQVKDALLPVPVGGSQGFTSQWRNAAKLENKGLELDLGATWFDKNDWKISTSVVWSRNRNKVLSLAGSKSLILNGFTGASSRAVEGQPLGVLWGVGYERNPETGAIVFDANNYPKIGTEEKVIGNPNPDWIGSITNSISYKGFSFSFMFDHTEGGDVWNGTRGALRNFGISEETGVTTEITGPTKNYAGTTLPLGPNRGEFVDFGAGPVFVDQSYWTGPGNGFGANAEQFIEDGTRTRLREISLGYSFSSEKFRKSSGLQSIDLSVSGRNIYLWTNYQGIDPETNLTGPSNGRGLDYFNNPSTRSVFFTVRLNY